MRRFTAAAAVAAFGLVAAACAPPAEEEQGPQGDTSVNIGWNQPFYSYNDDTSTGNATANANILYLMNGEFNYYNPDLELVQDESFGTYEKVSDDPLTVKYTVNEDVQWSDGTAVDAADMLLQWAALSGALNTVSGDKVERDPETGAPAETAGGQVFFDGQTPGLSLVTETPEIGDDNRSITMTYDKPFADWEDAFDMGVAAHATVMLATDESDPQAAKDTLIKAIQEKDNETLAKVANFWNTGYDYSSYPDNELLRLSSGAYLMTAFEENQFMTLEANPDYAGDRKASIEKITIRWNEDPLASVQALQNGELDMISPQSSPDVLQAVEGLEGVTVETGVEATYEHVDLTYNNGGPFDPKTYGGDEEKAKAVRLAFLKTIPRQEILEKLIVPLNPEAEVRNSQTITPGAPGYDEMVAGNGSSEFDAVDIEGAKQLLQQAGVQTPINVRFLFAADNVRREESFELIRQSAKQAGFNVQDKSNADWGSLLGSGTYDATEFGWQSTSTAVTESDANYSTGGLNNFGGFSDKRVDELYDELQTTTDEARQLEILTEVESILWADGFGVTIYDFPSITAYNGNISNVAPIKLSPTIFHGFWEWEAGGGES
ncbi:MAG TPA: ABC transporter family substrate-binding protein [Nocardioidaceae bacterium]|nr:ABC transporter family substrate-binding protein [Nocardioidaceae bacterium]